MDYTTLVASKSTPGSLASWANYGLAPAGDVLLDAQTLLYTTLRVREMLSDPTPVAVTQYASSASLPADFLDPIDVRDAQGKRLAHKDWSTVANRRALGNDGLLAMGSPGLFAILNSKLHFDCRASAATSLQMVYYAKPAMLGPSNLTNFLTDRYPMLLRTACLAVAADFRKHTEDYARTSQRLLTLIEQVNRENDLYLRGVEVDADYRRL